jgi:hypothetical protein
MALTTGQAQHGGKPTKKGMAIDPALRSAETRLHLFQTCRFTAAIISRQIGAARLHDGNFITGYEEAWRSNKQRAWTSIMWKIWKERNTRIFRQEHNSNFRVQQLIQDNIDIWIRAYST